MGVFVAMRKGGPIGQILLGLGTLALVALGGTLQVYVGGFPNDAGRTAESLHISAAGGESVAEPQQRTVETKKATSTGTENSPAAQSRDVPQQRNVCIPEGEASRLLQLMDDNFSQQDRDCLASFLLPVQPKQAQATGSTTNATTNSTIRPTTKATLTVSEAVPTAVGRHGAFTLTWQKEGGGFSDDQIALWLKRAQVVQANAEAKPAGVVERYRQAAESWPFMPQPGWRGWDVGSALLAFLAAACALPLALRKNGTPRHCTWLLVLAVFEVSLLAWGSFLTARAGQDYFLSRSLSVLLILAVLAWFWSRAELFKNYAYACQSRKRNAKTCPVAAGAGTGGGREGARCCRNLLPYQEWPLAHLTKLVKGAAQADDMRLITLKGGWGCGKSTLLMFLKDKLKSEPEPILVVDVNLWSHQTESNLLKAVVDELFYQSEVFPQHWLLSAPISFAFSDFAGLIGGLVDKLELSFKGLKADVALAALPSIALQPFLHAIIGNLVQNSKHVCFVMDEIDRAAPLPAQQALTLIRRTLEVPGVSVVMPFVSQQMHYKVFNPLTPSLPDLGETMMAVLWSHYFQNEKMDGCDFKGDWGGFVASERGMTRKQLPEETILGQHVGYLRHQLLCKYREADPRKRYMLHGAFAEKYLGNWQVSLGPLGIDDLLALLERLCWDQMEKFGMPVHSEDELQKEMRLIAKRWDEMGSAPHDTLKKASARHVVQYLNKAMCSAEEDSKFVNVLRGSNQEERARAVAGLLYLVAFQAANVTDSTRGA